MPRPKALSDHEMIAARWEYEATPISARQLAVKYGCSKSTMATIVLEHAWHKAEKLRTYEGEAGQRAFQRDVKAAIKAAYDRQLVKALSTRLTLPPAGNWTPGTNHGNPFLQAWAIDPDAPPSSQNPPPPTIEGEAGVSSLLGEVVQFPGTYRAKSGKPGQVPSQIEAAATRVHLATLRGQMSIQQFARLDRHEQLLDDVTHLTSVFVAPARHVDVSGLNDDEAAARLEQVSRAAARIILPTERDTLHGLLATLNKATIATITTQRVVAGFGTRPRDSSSKDEEEPAASPARSLQGMPTEELRRIRHAMDVLQGHANQRSEAPKPPPPDPIDDLADEDEPRERAG